MGEGAPKETTEQGSYSAFEGGSFEDYFHAAKVRAEGVENAMTGMGEAARIANDLERLGNMGKNFPEFSKWIGRRFSDISGIADKAKNGENFEEEMKEWHLNVGEAGLMWGNFPREEYMREYPHVEKFLGGIAVLRKIREAINENALESERNSDLKDVEYIEDVEIPSFLMDHERQSAAKVKRTKLLAKYRIKFSE